jgi:hypothetical protein
MNPRGLPDFLQPYFWDVEFDKLDPVADERFIAERLMEKTTPETFRWILAKVSKAMLREIAHTSRRLPVRDRTFWRLYLGET